MEKLLYKLVIPCDPRTKKNHGRIVFNAKTRKRCLIPSQKYVDYEELFKAYALKERMFGLMLNGEYNIRCLYYLKTLRRVDINNLLEATDDCLCAAKIIEDDNCSIVCGHDGSRVLLDRTNPRTEIYIEEMEIDSDFVAHKREKNKSG